jgi:alkylation response protein AidB-like acyl-CoA dehydrogenase
MPSIVKKSFHKFVRCRERDERMGFALTEEQGFIKDTIHRFVVKECEREMVKRMDEEGIFPEDLFRKLAGIGLCGLTIPEEYGGGGPNVLGAVLVIAELASIYPPLAGIFAIHSLLGGQALADMGTEDQKKRYLPGILDGSMLMTAALKETDQGCEEKGSGTMARQVDQRVLLNGIKSSVPLADHASLILVHIPTAKDGLTPGFFIIDVRSSGISVRPFEQVGFRGMSLCEMSLNGVAVSLEDKLGGNVDDDNAEQEQWSDLISFEDLSVAACGVGIAQGAFEYALNYAKERVQFGRPIVKFGAVQEMLINMAHKTYMANLLTYQAASLVDEGKKSSVEIMQARLAATEAARTVALYGVQIFGGYGYAMEYDAQRYFRDAVTLLTGGVPRHVLNNRLGLLLGY